MSAETLRELLAIAAARDPALAARLLAALATPEAVPDVPR